MEVLITMRIATQRLAVAFADIVSSSASDLEGQQEDYDEITAKLCRESTKAWRDLQAYYLSQAKILLCTASTAGRKMLRNFPAQSVTVEEAAQLPKGETINALIRAYRTLPKLIVFGDPAQLQPTVLSLNMNEFYEHHIKSLMLRVQQTGLPQITLLEQRRMDPDISAFVNEESYSGSLRDHPSVVGRRGAMAFRNWMQKLGSDNQTTLSPRAILFISVPDSEVIRRKGCTSLANRFFLDVLHSTLRSMHQALSGKKQDGKQITFGTLCFYAEEIKLLRQWLHVNHGLSNVELMVQSVDASSGKEYDYVIVSCCRPGGRFGLGFVADKKRQNVALSRARDGLVVIGHENMGEMQAGTGGPPRPGFRCWQNLVTYCKRKGAFMQMTAIPGNVSQALGMKQDEWEVLPSGRN